MGVVGLRSEAISSTQKSRPITDTDTLPEDHRRSPPADGGGRTEVRVVEPSR